MSFLTFDRTDITQTGQAERGTMEVLPLSKGKRQNKIVLGDADGMIQAFGMRKGEETRSLVFKTPLGGEPISSLTLGTAPGQEDKIFVSSGTTVRGINKKGKEFFKFSTNLTEPISDIHVDHTNIWATGKYVSNHYVDCADVHYFQSNDYIADVAHAAVVLDGEKNPILACRDRFIRVVQGGDLYYEAAVPGAATTVHCCSKNDELRRQATGAGSSQKSKVPNQQHAGRREVLFGTEQGSVGQLFLDGESVQRGWVIDTPTKNSGAVTAIHGECDLTGDGVNDVVVGRDDGSIEVYSLDEHGDPILAGQVNVGEAVQTLRHGCVTTPFNEIIAHTYSGKVIAFRPGADSTSADGFAMGEQLDDTQLGVRRLKDQQRVDNLTEEIDRLEKEVETQRTAYQSRSGDLIAADGACSILSRFKLDSHSATHKLTLEAPVAMEAVAVFSDVAVDLLDEYGAGGISGSAEDVTASNSNIPTADASSGSTAAGSIVSRTPLDASMAAGGKSAQALALYRLPSANQNRFEIEMRCVEGRAGTIKASVVPLRNPKTCVEVTKDVKPLCLHRRRQVGFEGLESGNASVSGQNSSTAVLGDNRALNILTITGSFTLEDAHQWTFECLDEVPSKPPNPTAVGGLFGDGDEDGGAQSFQTNGGRGIPSNARGTSYVFSYDFENVLLKTKLRVSGKEGELRFWSDGVTPLALVKEFIGQRSVKANISIRFAFDADEKTPRKFALLVDPLLTESMSLVKQATLVKGLKELKMQEPDVESFLSNEWKGILSNEDSIVKEAKKNLGKLEYLKGVIKDFFVDWWKFAGENVKHVMGEVDEVFLEYSLEGLTKVLERQ